MLCSAITNWLTIEFQSINPTVLDLKIQIYLQHKYDEKQPLQERKKRQKIIWNTIALWIYPITHQFLCDKIGKKYEKFSNQR